LTSCVAAGIDRVGARLASEIPLMRSRGFDAEPLRHLRSSTSSTTIARGRRTARSSRAVALARRAGRDVPEMPERSRVPSQTRCWWTQLLGGAGVAEGIGPPWAPGSASDAVAPPGVPPFGPGLTPARSRRTRARCLVLRPAASPWPTHARSCPRSTRSAAPLGYRYSSDPLTYWSGAPLVIYMTAEPFEYRPRPWPENIVMSDRAPGSPRGTPSVLDGIERPIVLVTYLLGVPG